MSAHVLIRTTFSKQVLYSASYVGCQRDAARICCWSPCTADAVAAEPRRLLSIHISCQLGALQQTRPSMAGQTDGRYSTVSKSLLRMHQVNDIMKASSNNSKTKYLWVVGSDVKLEGAETWIERRQKWSWCRTVWFMGSKTLSVRWRASVYSTDLDLGAGNSLPLPFRPVLSLPSAPLRSSPFLLLPLISRLTPFSFLPWH